MAIVEFSLTKFRSKFPQFTEEIISDEVLTELWTEACLYVNNTDTSYFKYDPDNGIYERAIALDLVMCHLATIATWPLGQSGKITNVSEGSVSTGFDKINANSINGQFWTQTPCGTRYYIMLRAYTLGGRFYNHKENHSWG